jgi:hypothetical protein
LEVHSKDPSEESEREEDSGDEGEVDLRVTDKQRQTQRDKERGRVTRDRESRSARLTEVFSLLTAVTLLMAGARTG